MITTRKTISNSFRTSLTYTTKLNPPCLTVPPNTKKNNKLDFWLPLKNTNSTQKPVSLKFRFATTIFYSLLTTLKNPKISSTLSEMPNKPTKTFKNYRTLAKLAMTKSTPSCKNPKSSKDSTQSNALVTLKT